MYFLALFSFLCLAVIVRAAAIVPREKRSSQDSNMSPKRLGPCSLGVFLGSGGHTSEALALVSALDFSRYTPRTYVISEGDHLSAQKALALELSRSSDVSEFQVVTVPRARRVHQSLLKTLPTALYSALYCVYHVSLAPVLARAEKHGPFPVDVLLLNGPGTCFVLCAAVYLNKLLGLPSPKVVYVESFARVNSLSLSGKLLRRLVDRFIVQWPHVLQDNGRGECHGWLV